MSDDGKPEIPELNPTGEVPEPDLDLVEFHAEVFAGLDLLAGSGGIRDIYREEDVA